MAWKKVTAENLPDYNVRVLALDWGGEILVTRRTIRWDWHWKGDRVFNPRFSHWDDLPVLPHDLRCSKNPTKDTTE